MSVFRPTETELYSAVARSTSSAKLGNQAVPNKTI